MEAVYALVGLVVGVIVAVVLMKQAQKPLESRFNDAKTQLEQSAANIKLEQARVDECNKELQETKATIAQLTATIEERDRSHSEKLLAYQTAEAQFKDTFKALSGEALENSTKQLLAQSEELFKKFKESADDDDESRKKEIESLLSPVKENLTKLDEHNREMEKNRAGAYKDLMEQVGFLREQHSGLTKETTRLVKALQDPGTAGSWGEMALERVVELAGLDEHWSFLTQETVDTEDGKQRPDMIINLPGGRSLIVDSKAPMRVYLNALAAEDEATKKTLLLEHANKLLGHAKEMRKRDYSKQIQSAPDFIVLFVPSESAYRMAAEARPNIFEEAGEFNVLITTPMALLPLLKAVAYGWKQEKLAQSARQLQVDAAKLYERISKIASHYNQLGKSLQSATQKFNDMGASLESRVLPIARKFKDHGIQSNTEIALVETIEFDPRTLVSQELATSDKPSLPGMD